MQPLTHPFSAGGFLCFCHVCNLQTIIERMKRIPAELLQAAMGRTVAPPGGCQSRSDAREPAGHRSRCGPSVALPGPSWGRQSWADARAPAGHRSRCGPSVALLGPSWGRQSWVDARAPAGHRSRCGPSAALLAPPGAVGAGRMPGHRQGIGAAAGRLWPSWA